MVFRPKDWCAASLALAVVVGVYTWSLWGSAAFGSLADQPFHLTLAAEFERAWRDGDFPPRWAAGANGGRGSVGFVVYPPVFAFLTVCWVRLGTTLVDALRLAVLSCAAGAFAAVYFLALGWLSPRRSVVAAATVLLLPGVTFVALGRGMFPQFASLGWAALLLGAGQRAVLGRRAWFHAGLAAVAAAGLVLTHSLTAYLLGVLLLMLSPLVGKALDPRGVASTCLVAAAGAALSCWYWLPLLHSGSYTWVDYLAQSHPYRDTVLGFGAAGASRGNAAGGSAFAQDWVFLNDLGRYIVLAQSLLALLVSLVLSADSRDDRRSGRPSGYGPGNGVVFLRTLPWVAGFAFFAATEPGAWLLLRLPRTELIQFSWRWQVLVALWCGVGLAALPRERRSLLPAGIAGVMLVGFSPLLSRSEARPGDQRSDLPAVLSREQFAALPSLDRAAYAGNLIELRPNRSDTRYYLPAPFGRAEVVSGTAEVKPRIVRTSYRAYSVEAAGGVTIRLVTYHAPGWSARLDGREVSIHTERGTGLQLIEAPAGTHVLEMEYRVPWPW